MKIISIDPGGTTGWTTFQINSMRTPRWHPELVNHFASGQFKNPDHHNELDKFLQATWPDLILYESFQNRNNDFAELISAEYIGVIKRFAQRQQRKLISQTPSEGLKWADDKKMAHLGLIIKPYTPNKDANASRKHMLYFLAHKTLAPVSGHIMQLLKDL